MERVQAAAVRLGLDAFRLEVMKAEDIIPSIEAAKGAADRCMFAAIPSSPRGGLHQHVCGQHQVANHACIREHVLAGGLMSYGPNFPALFDVQAITSTISSWLEARRQPRRAAAQVRSSLQQHDRESARLDHPRMTLVRVTEMMR